jgi:hypothetical protein
VATRIGAEGLGDGIDEAIDVTDDPASFAERIVTLLTDEATWKARRRSIAAYVQRLKKAPRRRWDEIIGAVLSDERPSIRHERTTYRSGRL